MGDPDLAQVRRIAAELGINPDDPMTAAQHEAWHSAMAVSFTPPVTMTDKQIAEFRDNFAAAMAGQKDHPLRVLHREPLSPDEIRSLLRECVTVVKPGETLIVRVPTDWTMAQVDQYVALCDKALERGGYAFRIVVLPAEGLGAAERHDA
jgi:hypothetical protein